MKKAISVCWKDTILVLSDRSALAFMLLAPFLLTLGMAMVTGSLSQNSSSSGITDVSVMIINQDQGELGQVLADVFFDEDMFVVEETADVVAARKAVDDDAAAALVLIPDDFSQGLLDEDAREAAVEVYSNPNRPISAGIVRSVTQAVINQLEITPISVRVSLNQLLEAGILSPQDIPLVAEQIAEYLNEEQAESLISVQRIDVQTVENDFNVMAYLAPGIAIFFLMYTVSQGARSILLERERGTLARMLISPTSGVAILGGKLLGIFLLGFGQVMILVVTSALIFRLAWGQPVAVVLLVSSAVLGATGWGLLIAALARETWQVSSFGTALMLLFGILGGSFIPVSNFGDWMRVVSKITPHAWASDGFLTLSTGGSLLMILPNILALLLMAFILFSVAALIARKRWVAV